MSDSGLPPPPGNSVSTGSGDPHDPSSSASLYAWLETKWLGACLGLLVEGGKYTSMTAVRSAIVGPGVSAAQAEKVKETLCNLFPKPGQRLKVRTLLEELQSSARTAPRASKSADAPPSKPNEVELDVTDDEKQGRDDSDDEADPTVSAEKRLAGESVSSRPEEAPKPAATAIVGNEKPLWKEVVDKSSGKPYWYNRVTKETTWDNPISKIEAAPVVAPPPQPQPSPVAKSGDKPVEKPLWKEVVDKSSGKSYWYNRVTKEVTWDDPNVGTAPAAAPTDNGAAAAATAAAAAEAVRKQEADARAEQKRKREEAEREARDELAAAPARVCLFFAGKRLESGALSDCGIRDGSVVHFVVRKEDN
jgi:hypothetical protein